MRILHVILTSLLFAISTAIYAFPQTILPGVTVPLELFFSTGQNHIINFKGVRNPYFFSGQTPPNGWHHLCFETDQIHGACIDKAYEVFGEPKNEVIVAIIDSGVDINHQDLQGKIWINRAELLNNNADDDGNGYVDDIFGWNFLGAPNISARNFYSHDQKTQHLSPLPADQHLIYETLAKTRLVKDLLSKPDITDSEKEKIRIFRKEAHSQIQTGLRNISMLEKQIQQYEESEDTLKAAGLEEITLQTLKNFIPQNEKELIAQQRMTLIILQDVDIHKIKSRFFYYNALAKHAYNLENEERLNIVRDNPEDPHERYYGNNDIIGPYSHHGTHVAGIVAARRDNNSSVKGIASNAKIMAIKVVPIGDERDKDVANAIYYAVNNGAKIINMSFGKGVSRYTKVVEEAILYAQEHDVLIVSAAGNDNENIDQVSYYPSSILSDQSRAKNFLSVGASTYRNDSGLAASFSNFGKNRVDLFAPGKAITSLAPSNTYQELSGTSMAAPVVAAVAAVIWGHHPHLTAVEMAELIRKSATDLGQHQIRKLGVGSAKFEELSQTGAIVNLYNALLKL